MVEGHSSLVLRPISFASLDIVPFCTSTTCKEEKVIQQ